MNLVLPPDIESRLSRLAADTGRDPKQLALELLTESLNHDLWFRSEVDRGKASARAGRLLDHDEVVVRFDRRYRG